MEIVVSSSGNVRCLYSESIDLTALGEVTLQRASHVEPDSAGQWWADLRLVKGPVIGPFALRSQALAGEVGWLRSNWLLPRGSKIHTSS